MGCRCFRCPRSPLFKTTTLFSKHLVETTPTRKHRQQTQELWDRTAAAMALGREQALVYMLIDRWWLATTQVGVACSVGGAGRA